MSNARQLSTLRADSNGNFGMGTTSISTDARLVLSKAGAAGIEFSIDNAVAGTNRIMSYDRTNNAGIPLTFNAGGGEAMRVDSTQVKFTSPVNFSGGLAAKRTYSMIGTFTAGTWYEVANSTGTLTEAGTYIATVYMYTSGSGVGDYFWTGASVPFHWSVIGSNSTLTWQLPQLYGTGHALATDPGPVLRLRLSQNTDGKQYIDIKFGSTISPTGNGGDKEVIVTFKRIA
jgi:hypothetical protein